MSEEEIMVKERLEPLAISVEDAARKLSISRSLCWELVWTGRLKTISLGRRRLVPIKVLQELMAEAQEEGSS